MIRKYAQHPPVFVPDPGEVIHARRSIVDDQFTKAVVTQARRQRDGQIKLTVYWLEDDPKAETPIRKGEPGWIVFHPRVINSKVRQDFMDRS
jgi:hypothetical protein